MREIWDLYTLSQTAKGITDITLRNYAQHLHSISKHLDIDVPMSEISKQDLDMMVVSMREAGLSNNSIATYVRRMRAFLGWCNREGYSTLKMAHIKEQDTVKETYTDEELEKLLKRPKLTSNAFFLVVMVLFIVVPFCALGTWLLFGSHPYLFLWEVFVFVVSLTVVI